MSRNLPSERSAAEIRRARAHERRDCRHYEHDCLTKAAIADALCVPCEMEGKKCRRFHRKPRQVIEEDKRGLAMAGKKLLQIVGGD